MSISNATDVGHYLGKNNVDNQASTAELALITAVVYACSGETLNMENCEKT